MHSPPNFISIEVAYANAQRYTLIPLNLPMGTTLCEAIRQSGILQLFPELTMLPLETSLVNTVGVFGELRSLDYVICPGDRIEIYRPLYQTPMELREKRVSSERRAHKKIKQTKLLG